MGGLMQGLAHRDRAHDTLSPALNPTLGVFVVTLLHGFVAPSDPALRSRSQTRGECIDPVEERLGEKRRANNGRAIR
jgi:hypothetical protein